MRLRFGKTSEKPVSSGAKAHRQQPPPLSESDHLWRAVRVLRAQVAELEHRLTLCERKQQSDRVRAARESKVEAASRPAAGQRLRGLPAYTPPEPVPNGR